MNKSHLFLFSLLILSAMLAVSGCTGNGTDGVYNMDKSAPAISPGKMVNVDVQTAKELIDSDSVFFMDVRTPEEFSEAHIYGAQPISLQELENPEFFAMIVESLPRDKPILVYCRSGRRSVSASEILIDADFAVYNMEGGIIEWEKAGYETVSLIE